MTTPPRWRSASSCGMMTRRFSATPWCDRAAWSAVAATVIMVAIFLAGGAQGFGIVLPPSLLTAAGSSTCFTGSRTADRGGYHHRVPFHPLRKSEKNVEENDAFLHSTPEDASTNKVPERSSPSSRPSSTTRRSSPSLGMRSVSRALSLTVLAVGVTALWSRRPAWAGGTNPKSRTDGYQVQKSEDEWKSTLSPMQYFVLRDGGTERPYYSVLESEDRPGTFVCAGCNTPLFAAKDKFHSGTGWPSFARALPGVEIQSVDPISMRLLGAELRCRTCGGHLGDVFSDGFLFVGTEAEKTGQRFCIDGAALVFYPDEEVSVEGSSSSSSLPVRGDTMSPTSKRKRKK